MLKKLLPYNSLILIPLLAGIFISLLVLKKEPVPAQESIKTAAEKKIVLDLREKKISLYEEGEIKNEFKITEDKIKEILYSLPSGMYLFSNLASFNFFDKDALQFADPLTQVFVLNDLEANPASSLDEQNFYFLKNKTEGKKFPKVSAEAFLVGDINTDSVIFQKNQDKKLAIASLTKLMTALVSLESMDQYRHITITKEMLSQGYGDYGNLRRGEKLTVGELIYPLLLESSNDAAVALAADYGTSEFVKLMNEKAVSLGLSNTSFEDSSGESAKNISTAKDLFHLVQDFYKNKRGVLDITKLKSVNYWRNNNFFTGNQKYLGGKNGYTDIAKETSVALFSSPLSKSGDRDIAIILLHSNDRENDILALLKWLENEVVFHEKIIPQKAFSFEEVQTIRKSLKEISFMFAGDVMLDRDVRESVIRNASGNFSFLFEKAGFLKEADITFGNLEGPISDMGEDSGNAYSFRMHPAVINSLKEAGFDVLSIANNHIGDYGKTAFEDTISRLENESIAPIGKNLKIIERDGVKTGFLAFSETGPDWIRIPENFEAITKDAAGQVDILIVSLHFGEEYQNKPNERQIKLARLAIDSGAKIVIGHHPHVIQDTENYKDGLVAYSLGNFIFDQIFSEETMKGLALEVVVSGDGKIKSVNKSVVKINKSYQPELAE